VPPVSGRFKSFMVKDDALILDSSVVIAALLSPTGGSFFVMTNLSATFRLLITEYILLEIYEVIFRKFKKSQDMQKELLAMMTVGNVQVIPTAPISDVRALYEVINREDAPILASALNYSRYLLSFDKHFFDRKVVHYAAERNVTICTPRDFIKNQRNHSEN
jgi:predicted nucleic acid-binding protein